MNTANTTHGNNEKKILVIYVKSQLNIHNSNMENPKKVINVIGVEKFSWNYSFLKKHVKQVYEGQKIINLSR